MLGKIIEFLFSEKPDELLDLIKIKIQNQCITHVPNTATIW